MQKRAVLGAISALAALPATASAYADLRFSPSRPIVDEDITVSWRTDRRLRKGTTYEVMFVKSCGGRGAGLVVKRAYVPRKGATARVRLSPGDALLYGDTGRWCQGLAPVTVDVVRRRGRGGGRLVAAEEIRIYGMP